MDYVDFCERILGVAAQAEEDDSQSRYRGVSIEAILRGLVGTGDTSDPEVLELPAVQAFLTAYRELLEAGLLETPRHTQGLSVTRAGRSVLRDALPHWRTIGQEELQPDEQALLKKLNERSQVCANDHAAVEWVKNEDLAQALDWSPIEKGLDRVERIVGELRKVRLAERPPWVDSAHREARSTYNGLVWDTRRDRVFIWDKIDRLVQEWETTTVDFKRELHLKNNDQKAEFVKDVIGLANTQASGDRWLVVGFDDKTRAYYAPADPAAQEQHNKDLEMLKPETIDQILSTYTEQPIRTKFNRVQYREGVVLMLQVLREPRMVPHRVKKRCAGASKKVEVGDIFVRHGSLTQVPTSDELHALYDEAERSRVGLG